MGRGSSEASTCWPSEIVLAPSGIRINAVCPGVVETPMFAALTEKTPDAMREVMRDQTIARLGRPEEIAAAVLWLCSSAASFEERDPDRNLLSLRE